MAPSYPTSPLGKDGPLVQRLGYGMMGLSFGYGKVPSVEERLKFLDELFDLGSYFWDSADMYADSEDIVGEWFKRNPAKRKDIFLATKFAHRANDQGGYDIDSTPEWALKACDLSLARLGVDTIDLYYCHRLDGVTPIEKTVGAMAQLKSQGKIRHLGLSECSAASLRRAHAVHPIAAVQVEYSPFALDIETPQIDVLRVARELGVAVVCYAPIGRGMLSGAYRSLDDFDETDWRRFMPRFSAENFPKNLQLVDDITAIAKEKGVTASQLTLAWLMAQGKDVFPIPGSTKIHRVKENLGAVEVKLTEEEEKKIRKACEEATVVGGRYPEAFSAVLYNDTPPLHE